MIEPSPSRTFAPIAGGLPAAVVLTLALLVTGCGVPDGPRELTSPRLDVEGPFRTEREAAGGAAGTGGSEAEGASGFAERLRRRTSAPAERVAEGETVALQRLSVGGGLAAELPAGTGGWSWAAEGEVTLAVREEGGTAEALVYVDPFTAASRRRPSMDAHRFLLGVDRGLASVPMRYGSELWPLASQAAPYLPLSAGEILSALEMLHTPTLGRGLAYRSQPDSFSGWRWIGSNRHGTLLRLGRTHGTWGDPLPLADEVEVLLEVLSEPAPELGSLLWQGPPAGRAGDPAWMVLGSATPNDGRGVHLAILCRRRPDCAATEDLGRFLDSLRPPDGPLAGPVAGFGSETLHDLAQRHGLALHPTANGTGSSLAATLASALSQIRPDPGRAADAPGGES